MVFYLASGILTKQHTGAIATNYVNSSNVHLAPALVLFSDKHHHFCGITSSLSTCFHSFLTPFLVLMYRNTPTIQQ